MADCVSEDDALCKCQMQFLGRATRKVNPNKWLLGPTKFVHKITGEECVQCMQCPDGHALGGQQKGTVSVLRERGEATTDSSGRELNHQFCLCKTMGNLYDFSRSDTGCCLMRKVALLPDFRAEKPRIFQTCEKHGGICIFLPAFHCELNFIERVWADVKRWIRKYHSDDKSLKMQQKMEHAIDRLPLATCRRCPKHCTCIHACMYTCTLPPPQAITSFVFSPLPNPSRCAGAPEPVKEWNQHVALVCPARWHSSLRSSALPTAACLRG